MYQDWELKRFAEKWDGYVEQQSLSGIACEVPLMKLRAEALKLVLQKEEDNTKDTSTGDGGGGGGTEQKGDTENDTKSDAATPADTSDSDQTPKMKLRIY